MERGVCRTTPATRHRVKGSFVYEGVRKRGGGGAGKRCHGNAPCYTSCADPAGSTQGGETTVECGVWWVHRTRVGRVPNRPDGRRFHRRVVGHFDGNYHDEILGKRSEKKSSLSRIGDEERTSVDDETINAPRDIMIKNINAIEKPNLIEILNK